MRGCQRPGHGRCPAGDPRIHAPSCRQTRARNPLPRPNPCRCRGCRLVRAEREVRPIRGDWQARGPLGAPLPDPKPRERRQPDAGYIGSDHRRHQPRSNHSAVQVPSPRGAPTHLAIRSGRSVAHTEIPPAADPPGNCQRSRVDHSVCQRVVPTDRCTNLEDRLRVASRRDVAKWRSVTPNGPSPAGPCQTRSWTSTDGRRQRCQPPYDWFVLDLTADRRSRPPEVGPVLPTGGAVSRSYRSAHDWDRTVLAADGVIGRSNILRSRRADLQW